MRLAADMDERIIRPSLWSDPLSERELRDAIQVLLKAEAGLKEAQEKICLQEIGMNDICESLNEVRGENAKFRLALRKLARNDTDRQPSYTSHEMQQIAAEAIADHPM